MKLINTTLLIILSFSSMFSQMEELAISSQNFDLKTDPNFSKENSDQPVYNTFYTTRVINSHSTETLWKKQLDFRIGHRFGDLGGSNGGVKTLFGIDNAADIAVGFEYGITNDLNIGITRYKGAGPYRQLYEGYLKYKFLRQTSEKMPVSVVGVFKSNITSMEATNDSTSSTSFNEFAHRVSYSTQLLIARKFSDRFTLQIMPTYVNRNYVGFNENNGTFGIGAGFRLQLTKLMGIVGEYHYVTKSESALIDQQDPFGLAFEFNTGGHVFQLNLTNSRGFGEAQYIPTTYSQADKGQIRIGFTISRIFKL